MTKEEKAKWSWVNMYWTRNETGLKKTSKTRRQNKRSIKGKIKQRVRQNPEEC